MAWSFYDYGPTLVGAVIALISTVQVLVFMSFSYGSSNAIFSQPLLSGQSVSSMVKASIPSQLLHRSQLFKQSVMIVGYIFRAVSSQDTTALGPYIVQNICLLLPPSLYAATIYMIYGRIVLYTQSPELFIISPAKVTKILVLRDVFAFLLQASGGGMMAISSMAKWARI